MNHPELVHGLQLLPCALGDNGDPALLEPITDAAPGVTQSCGVCGAPFVAVDSLFCEAHRG